MIGDCKKEYRTQWELNSHRRTKHANEPINQTDDRGLVNELPRQLLNDGSECRKPSPPKTRNKQKIIYVLPGPQLNYVSLIPSDCSIVFYIFVQSLEFKMYLLLDGFPRRHPAKIRQSIETCASIARQLLRHPRWIIIICEQPNNMRCRRMNIPKYPLATAKVY